MSLIDAPAVTIEVARLNIKPGESLLATIKSKATNMEVEQLRQALMQVVPNGAKVLIAAADIDFSIVESGEDHF